jgi:uncharacterized protein (TIGR02466 family)
MGFDLCFPTAILSQQIFDYEKINSALIPRIREIQSTIPTGGKNWLGRPYNTCGTFDIVADPAFKDITANVSRMVHVYASRLGVDISRNSFACKEGWLNIYKQSDFQEFHYHGGFHFSAVYYVQAPKDSSQLIFETPLPPEMNPLPISMHGNMTDQRARYTAEAGKVIVFRSHLRHCVPAHTSDEDRISLAFNFA